jgi:hypothetical protein
MSRFQLKPIETDAIPRALEKAERYRLLNEPEEAESICLDILAVDPNHQQALVTLLLALTDQFPTNGAQARSRAQKLLPRLHSEYERCYYAGIICERRANSHLATQQPHSGVVAYGWLQEAMEWYEKADALRPPRNDDATLRWNTCARIIMKHDLHPPAPEEQEALLLE